MLPQHLLLGQLLQLFLHLTVSQLTVKECILNSAPMSREPDPIPSTLLIQCIDYVLSSLTDLFNSSLASSHNASNQLLLHLFLKRCVLITMI